MSGRWRHRNIGLEENAGRKTLALFGRAAPRDFVDVYNLARRFGKPKLLELAAERDLGFDRGVFGQMARMVNQINARQFPLGEDSVPDLVAFFNDWSEELREEREIQWPGGGDPGRNAPRRTRSITRQVRLTANSESMFAGS